MHYFLTHISLKCTLDAQKNRLINKTVLSSTHNKYSDFSIMHLPCLNVAQLVRSLKDDPGVVSSIPAFVEID